MRRDLAWHCTETNEMGIDDFYRWSQKAGTEIMLAVNMGTWGLKAAHRRARVCQRRARQPLGGSARTNGIEEPMDIKMWCIGNEMDGQWQVGHMSPEEYAGAVDKVAHAMKLAESGLELVAPRFLGCLYADLRHVGEDRAHQGSRESRLRLLPCLLLRLRP